MLQCLLAFCWYQRVMFRALSDIVVRVLGGLATWVFDRFIGLELGFRLYSLGLV